jgi:hypothetical protein
MEIALLLILAAAMGGRSSPPDSDAGTGGSAGTDAGPDSAGLDQLRQLLARTGLSQDWQTFFQAVAGGESNWNNRVGLGPNDHAGRPPFLNASKASAGMQSAEARAALRAYENRQSLFASCDWPAARYTFGSAGWFGLLPAYGLYAFRGTPLVCADPWDTADPAVSVVMAIDFARRTMQNRNPTSWLALRTGWGWPARTNDPTQQARVMNKTRGLGFQLDRLGIARAWATEKPTPLPARDPVAMLERLR